MVTFLSPSPPSSYHVDGSLVCVDEVQRGCDDPELARLQYAPRLHVEPALGEARVEGRVTVALLEALLDDGGPLAELHAEHPPLGAGMQVDI